MTAPQGLWISGVALRSALNSPLTKSLCSDSMTPQ